MSRSVPPSASNVGAFQTASLLRMRHTPTSVPTVNTNSPVQRFTKQDGVYVGDAAPGEVSLSVFLDGRRVIRIEIAEEFYSRKWFRFLEAFVRRHGGSALKLVD